MLYQPNPVKILFPEIKELLQEKNHTLLKQVLRECNPIGFADFWKKFTPEEQIEIFKLLPERSALKVFEILDIQDQHELLSKLDEKNVTPILDNIESADIVQILHTMSARTVKKMKNLIKRQEALAQVNLMMTYPEHSAGSHMHPEFIKLGPRLTARQALNTEQGIRRGGGILKDEVKYELPLTNNH